MKSYGKVLEYDSYTGKIRGIDGNIYLMLSNDIIDKDIRVDDYVSFDSEVYSDVELTRYVARFVKKINKEDIKD